MKRCFMNKRYFSPNVEFVILGNEDVIVASECDFHCDENCSCYFCVGVCTWDCTADSSTCRTGDFN